MSSQQPRMQLPVNVTCADPQASLLAICAPPSVPSGARMWTAANVSLVQLVDAIRDCGCADSLLLLDKAIQGSKPRPPPQPPATAKPPQPPRPAS